MPTAAFDTFRIRLQQVAASSVLPGGLDVSAAVVLAEDLLAKRYEGDATVALACLRRDTSVFEAEPAVRLMLHEYGFDLPKAESEEDRYEVLLYAFGYLDLPFHFFEGPYYWRVPAWDKQGPLDRSLVMLLDRHDNETVPARKVAIEDEMRAVVRHQLPAPQ